MGKVMKLLRMVVLLALAILLLAAGSLPGAAAPQPEVTLELVAQLRGATYAVHAVGNYAFIGEGPRLVILDISMPNLRGLCFCLPHGPHQTRRHCRQRTRNHPFGIQPRDGTSQTS